MSQLVCPHQPNCPGCPRLATPGPAPQALERLLALAARAGLPAPRCHQGPTTGFRRRARLAIRGRADAPKLGIFEAGSHRVAHIPKCLVHHPVVNRVAAAVREALARHSVPTYSDTAHLGVARYLQVVVERETDLAQVTLVTNGESPNGLAAFFDDLRNMLDGALHSLFWNGNPERTNTILGPHWEHLHGPAFVADHSGDARIFYPPDAFGQSNLDLGMQLAARVRELVPAAARVSEFYAGVGAIGLGLATTSAQLSLNELGAGSLCGLRHGVQALPEATRARVRVASGPASEHTHLVQDSDVVLVDPPRKGLDPELLRALANRPPARLLYVSCGIDSFERDAALLMESARLTALEAFDLFPHTDHLETLAIFEPRPA